MGFKWPWIECFVNTSTVLCTIGKLVVVKYFEVNEL